MNHSDGMEIFKELSNRYGINLKIAEWSSRKIFGGIALPDALICVLHEIEERYGGKVAIVYEMETTKKEFEPLEIPLTVDGFHILRRELISHFDLLFVPSSGRWAMATNHEMEATIFGPKEIIDLLPDESVI